VQGLRASPVLGNPVTEAQRVETIYYDSRRAKLHEAGVSLCIRDDGDEQIQTLKLVSAAGLFIRPEWEKQLAHHKPELTPLPPAVAQFVDPRTSRWLHPVFQTSISRTGWHVARNSAVINLVLDQGEFSANGRSLPISQLGLGLENGLPSALFDLARELNQLIPLRLIVADEAELGYRLIAGEEDSPARAAPISLHRGMATTDAFQLIARSCLAQFRLNQDMLQGPAADETLHQARVGLRRLRSALSMFKPLFTGDVEARTLRDELGWLTSASAETRKLDVLIGQMHDGGLRHQIEGARADSFARTTETMASTRACRLMLDLAQWLAFGEWVTAPAGNPEGCKPIEKSARAILDRFRRRLGEGKPLPRLSRSEQHHLRIETKKMRHAVEFFQPLYPVKNSIRGLGKLGRTLGRLQDCLGTLNDCYERPALLASLGLDGNLLAELGEPPGPEPKALLAEAELARRAIGKTRAVLAGLR
jgi:inorganic triphosphatase YgiF